MRAEEKTSEVKGPSAARFFSIVPPFFNVTDENPGTTLARPVQTKSTTLSLKTSSGVSTASVCSIPFSLFMTGKSESGTSDTTGISPVSTYFFKHSEPVSSLQPTISLILCLSLIFSSLNFFNRCSITTSGPLSSATPLP